MNKIIGAVSSIVLAFYTEAISIECYRKYVEVRTSDKNGGGIQYQNQFSLSTDPIRGKILLDSQILDRFRFCGDIDFFSKVTRKPSVVGNVLSRANSESENALPKKAPGKEMNRDDGKTCSFSDKSKNAMTELLIYLFPSAGPSLNAQGAGALDKDVYDIVDIIVGMFKIARDVRQGGKDHEIFKEINAVEVEKGKRPARKSFLNKYFNLYKERSNDEQTPQTKPANESGEMSQGILLNSKQGKSENELLKEARRKERREKRGMQKNPEQLKTQLSSSSESSEAKKINNSTANMLVELAKSVANAVLLEASEDGKVAGEYDSAQLFPRYFVNDLICAYVWAALPDRRLGDLLERLATANIKDALDTTYKSHLGEDVIKNEGHIVSLVPFRPGQYITKHAIAHYYGSGFSDCVETMLRQFFTTLFSSYEKGEDGGRLYLDVKRAPVGSKLRHFFEKNDDARRVANDGSREVRDAWAEVVSGLSIEKVYRNETHIIAGGWDNSIKVICTLMEGYSAGDSPQEGEPFEVWQRKKNAEKRIKDVNAAVRNGTFNISAKETLNVINDLLGIRTDVKLIAKEEVDNDLLNGSGCIEGGLVIYPEGHEECNSLYFGNYDNHAELSSIPRFKAIKRDDPPPASSLLWIEKLYYDEDFAINGKKAKGLLSEARYPTFEYYRRLLKEKRAYYISAISEKINEEAYIEGIARSFYGNNCEFELSNVIKRLLQADAFLENIVKFCSFIAKRAENPSHASIAVSFLQKMAFLSELSPENLGKLSSDLELKANLGSQELKRLVPDGLDCLIEISSAELKSFKKLSQKALNGLKKLISADLESLKNKPLLINSSVADLVIQRCNFKKYKEVDRLLAEKLKGLNDRMLEDEISPFFSSVARFYEKEWADFPLFDGGLLNSLCPYIEFLMGRLKTSEQKGLKADFFYNIISILDFIDFDTPQTLLCEFIEFIKSKGFFPVYSLELPIKRSDKKLELLLKVCDVSFVSDPDKILLEYTGTITPSMMKIFLLSVSEKNIKFLIDKAISTNGFLPKSPGDSVRFFKQFLGSFNDLFVLNNLYILRSALVATAQNLGGFTTAEAEEIITYIKTSEEASLDDLLIAIIPSMRAGEMLSSRALSAIKDKNKTTSYYNKCMTIADIFVHKLSISPFDEEVFAQIVLEAFDNNKIGEPVLIDLLKVAPLGFLQHCLTLLKNTSTKAEKWRKTFNFVNDSIKRFA